MANAVLHPMIVYECTSDPGDDPVVGDAVIGDGTSSRDSSSQCDNESGDCNMSDITLCRHEWTAEDVTTIFTLRRRFLAKEIETYGLANWKCGGHIWTKYYSALVSCHLSWLPNIAETRKRILDIERRFLNGKLAEPMFSIVNEFMGDALRGRKARYTVWNGGAAAVEIHRRKPALQEAAIDDVTSSSRKHSTLLPDLMCLEAIPRQRKRSPRRSNNTPPMPELVALPTDSTPLLVLPSTVVSQPPQSEAQDPEPPAPADPITSSLASWNVHRETLLKHSLMLNDVVAKTQKHDTHYSNIFRKLVDVQKAVDLVTQVHSSTLTTVTHLFIENENMKEKIKSMQVELEEAKALAERAKTVAFTRRHYPLNTAPQPPASPSAAIAVVQNEGVLEQ